MKLSIITINLNNVHGLKKTMESILAQTSRDYEWIVIDGGSTDGSRELIEQNQQHIAYWVSETDKGIYNAMNKGIEVAKGDYYLFLNSGDCFATPDIAQSFTPPDGDIFAPTNTYNRNNYEGVLSAFVASKPKADVIYGNAIYVDDRGKEVRRIYGPDRVTLSFFWNHWLHHQATFFHRRCFLELRYNEELRVVSDFQLCLQLLYNGYSFEKWNYIVTLAEDGGVSCIYPGVVDERKAVFNNIIPAGIRTEVDEIVWLRQVDLWQTVNSIVNSKRWVRNVARLVLFPFQFFLTRKL